MDIQIDVTQPVNLMVWLVNEKRLQAASLSLLLMSGGEVRDQVATCVAEQLAPDTWFDNAWKVVCGKVLNCEMVIQLDSGVFYATQDTLNQLTSLSVYFNGHELFGEDGLVLPVRIMHSVPNHLLH